MSEAALSLVVAAVVLAVGGGPLAWALTRSLAVAALLAPLVAALGATAAAVGAIATEAPLWPWLVAWLVVSGLGARWVLQRPDPPLADLVVPTGAVVAVVALLAPLLVFALRAPVGWDARTIWWFHAEWLEQGGDEFASALSDDAVGWTHADYPPLASAAVAGVRSLGGGLDPSRLALATSAWVSWSALALAAVALCAAVLGSRHPTSGGAAPRNDDLEGDAPRGSDLDGGAPDSVAPLAAGTHVLDGPVATGVVAGAALAGFGLLLVADRGLASGYVDHLWAALLAGAAVLALQHRPSPSSALAAAMLLGAAALTKNEGLAGAVVLVALALVRHRHRLRTHWVVPAALVPGIGWAVLVRALGATNDVADEGNASGLLGGDAEVWGRLDPTASAIVQLDYSVPFVAVAAVAALVAVVGGVGLSFRRRQLGIGSDLWLWVLFAGLVGTVVAAYLVSPTDLDWHLATSLSRTMLGPTLVLVVSVATWLAVALRALTGATASTAAPERAGEPATAERASRVHPVA